MGSSEDLWHLHQPVAGGLHDVRPQVWFVNFCNLLSCLLMFTVWSWTSTEIQFLLQHRELKQHVQSFGSRLSVALHVPMLVALKSYKVH